MTEMTDRERAIYFEGRMHKYCADLDWTREQLAEAHRIIGILIQNTTHGAGIVPNILRLWPGLHPHSKTPGEKRLAEWKELLAKSGASK